MKKLALLATGVLVVMIGFIAILYFLPSNSCCGHDDRCGKEMHDGKCERSHGKTECKEWTSTDGKMHKEICIEMRNGDGACSGHEKMEGCMHGKTEMHGCGDPGKMEGSCPHGSMEMSGSCEMGSGMMMGGCCCCCRMMHGGMMPGDTVHTDSIRIKVRAKL